MMQQDEFYIFLNMHDPLVKHNIITTKQITSAGYLYALQDPNSATKYLEGNADYLPFVLNSGSIPWKSFYFLSAINNYRVEYDAEVTRQKFFATLPSRLSAVYAFGNLENCEKVKQKYKWTSPVRKFKLLRDELTKIACVNMEVVSLMRSYPSVSWDHQTIRDIWAHYWEGKGNLSIEIPLSLGQKKVVESGEIWEYLIEGKLQLIEEDV